MLKFRGKPIAELLTEQMKQDLYHFEGNAQALKARDKASFSGDDMA